MKKAVSLILALIFLAYALPVAFGEESESEVLVDTTILFRDIPWITRCSDVERYLKNTLGDVGQIWMHGANSGRSVCDIACGRKTGIDLGAGYRFEGDLGIESMALFMPENQNELTVGGYMANGITLYFAYFSFDGVNVVKDDDNALLYAAQYILTPDNTYAAYQDLKRKITDIYGSYLRESANPEGIFGKSQTNIKYPDGFMGEEFTLWLDDENDSMLVLHYEDYSEDSNLIMKDNIQITYAYTKGDYLLKLAMEVEQREESGSSTDGL